MLIWLLWLLWLSIDIGTANGDAKKKDKAAKKEKPKEQDKNAPGKMSKMRSGMKKMMKKDDDEDELMMNMFDVSIVMQSIISLLGSNINDGTML